MISKYYNNPKILKTFTNEELFTAQQAALLLAQALLHEAGSRKNYTKNS